MGADKVDMLDLTTFYRLSKTALLNAQVLGERTALRLVQDVTTVAGSIAMSRRDIGCTWKAYKPILGEYGITSATAFIDTVRTLFSKRQYMRIERQNRRRVLSNPLLRRAICCHAAEWYDSWCLELWRRRGSPTFGKKVFHGCRAGMPILWTNGKTGWKTVITQRVAGVRVVTNGGKLQLHISIAG